MRRHNVDLHRATLLTGRSLERGVTVFPSRSEKELGARLAIPAVAQTGDTTLEVVLHLRLDPKGWVVESIETHSDSE